MFILSMHNSYKINNKSRIIFIALNGIGNLLLVTPVITNLKKNFPKCEITVLALNDSVNVVDSSPYVDKTIVYPAGKNLLSRIIFLLKLRRYNFDFSFYPYPNVNVMSALIAVLIGARVKVNFDYELFGRYSKFLNTVSLPMDLNKHDVEKNLDFLRAFNLKIFSKKLFMNVKDSDKRYIGKMLEGKLKKDGILVGMHVGSKASIRIWPIDNFAELVRKISKLKNVKIALVGSKIEKKLVKNYREFKGKNILNFIEKTTIPQTAALIQRCSLFVSTDSGPLHIAVAADTKVLSVNMREFIKRTSPFGKKHVVISNYRQYEKFDKNKNHIYVDEITPEIVFEYFKRELKIK